MPKIRKNVNPNDLSKLVGKFVSGQIPNLDELNRYFEDDYIEFMKTEKGLVIPGNTVKGAIRSRLELLMYDSCYNPLGIKRSKTISKRYIKIFHPPRDKDVENFDPESGQICPVCNLFGNAGLASRVNFSDLELKEGKIDYIPVRGLLYEVAKRGSIFTGDIIMHAPQPWEIGMLLYGAGYRKGGKWKTILLGRFKYERKEFGRVQFDIKIREATSNIRNSIIGKSHDDYLEAFLSKYKDKVRDVEEDWK
ncbi:MAG: hypothetical protein ASUL_08854 [Candidatus Aramenus sulfurataquae]|nr:MAG: hypothetical protein ASUL_08854 [Candidatus Aramenus sulfurataquae]